MTRIAITIALLAVASTAHAQPVQEQSDLTVLARCLTAEAGPVLVADHAAILAVLDRRARRTESSTAADVARRYCSVHRRPVGEHGRRVALMDSLELAEMAPEVFALVVGYLRGQRIHSPCPGADHWGDRRSDMERAMRSGWRRVRCVCTTRNLFWRSR